MYLSKAKYILFSLLVISCSTSFQSKYKVTDKKECSEVINFLKTEFYRDKKGILRTTKECRWMPKLRTESTFDTIVADSFLNIYQKSYNNVTKSCYNKMLITDFYATLGKPNFNGIHPLHKFHYLVYLITDTRTMNCPCGKIGKDGFFYYRHKMGYQVAYYCHFLEIKYRPADNSVYDLTIY